MITYTHDAKFVLKKWSTWLSLIAVSMGSVSLAWERMPESIHAMFPDWMRVVMAILSLVSAAAVPIATSIQQRSIPTLDPTATTYYQSSEEMP